MAVSAREIWQMQENEFLQFIEKNFLHYDGKKNVRFYAPSFMYYKTKYFCSSSKDFPTISVTGKGCALKCKHCEGKVLETMYPVESPLNLLELCARLKREGAYGCLVSGGCRPDGSVPLEKFANAIGKVKRELRLTVFVHTGIADFKTAKMLKEAGVDAALLDVIGSEETMREIYNLKVTVADYERSLKALHDVGITFVPHVIVGLHYGKLKGELHALEIISRHEPSALVIIAFMPIHGTKMANAEPPKPTDIAKVISMAKIMFPNKPLVLGCMRPKGKHRIETDILALKAGVNAIAFPAEEAIRFAENQGYSISFSSFCCSQIYLDINNV